MSPFRAQTIRAVLTHVGVGMGAASFWRGAWYVLDDHLFPDNAEASAFASLSLGTLGMAASQGLVGRIERLTTATNKINNSKPLMRLTMMRFGALYTIAMSCVLVWRGTWVGWDCLYARLHQHLPSLMSSSATTTSLAQHDDASSKTVSATDPGHATKSGALSHVVAIGLLLSTGLFASVLAPPAAVSVIRDLTVRAGVTPYAGPAQSTARQLFGGRWNGDVSTTRTSRIHHTARGRLFSNKK